jgi:hypothetical protein
MSDSEEELVQERAPGAPLPGQPAEQGILEIVPERQRPAEVQPASSSAVKWLYLAVVAGLVLVFAALMAYHIWTRDNFESNADPMHKLQTAALPDAQPRAANDWPQWRGPDRDGVSAETGLLTRWPEDGPEVLWRTKCGVGFSGVSVAGGRAYTLMQYKEGGEDREAVVSWDANTKGEGKELWRYSYPCQFNNDQGPGPRSTPTLDGDYVYAVGATGMLHCLKANTDKKDGELVWQHDLQKEFEARNPGWGVSFSPLVEGDLLLTTPGGRNGASVVAFHKRSGKVAWKALDDAVSYSSPIALTAAGKRQVLFFLASGLVSLDPETGQEYWRFPWKTSFDCNIATPIVVGNYVFISSGYAKGCALLEVVAEKGKPQVRLVYQGNRMCNHFASSVYYKEHLFGFNESTLICMEFRTGRVCWKEWGFKKGSLLVADGHLIILGEYGKLALARATPDGYREEAAHDFRTARRCWTVPYLADGKLFVRIPEGDEQQMLCLKLK